MPDEPRWAAAARLATRTGLSPIAFYLVVGIVLGLLEPPERFSGMLLRLPWLRPEAAPAG